MDERCAYVHPVTGRCALSKGHRWEHYADSNTNRPAVMNSPADEAEARDRAQRAPGQADRDAARSGVSGLTSRPEAGPVTPTRQFDWSSEPRVRVDLNTPRVLRLIEMDAVPAYLVRALLRERDEWRENYWDHLEHCTADSASEESK